MRSSDSMDNARPRPSFRLPDNAQTDWDAPNNAARVTVKMDDGRKSQALVHQISTQRQVIHAFDKATPGSGPDRMSLHQAAGGFG